MNYYLAHSNKRLVKKSTQTFESLHMVEYILGPKVQTRWKKIGFLCGANILYNFAKWTDAANSTDGPLQLVLCMKYLLFQVYTYIALPETSQIAWC